MAVLARFAPNEAKLYELWRQAFGTATFETTVSSLSPGSYRFSLALIPNLPTNTPPPPPNPLSPPYADESIFDLQPAEHKHLDFAFYPSPRWLARQPKPCGLADYEAQINALMSAAPGVKITPSSHVP